MSGAGRGYGSPRPQGPRTRPCGGPGRASGRIAGRAARLGVSSAHSTTERTELREQRAKTGYEIALADRAVLSWLLRPLERRGPLSHALIALDDSTQAEFDFDLCQNAIQDRSILPAIPGCEGFGVDRVHKGVDVLVLPIVVRDQQRLVFGQARAPTGPGRQPAP
jgi:hypothetical protein